MALSDNILAFIEAYKNLDALCKQVFSSERGISEYINEMDLNRYRQTAVLNWDRDYKQLKRMRWIRNKLVHEPTSFEEDSFSERDIAWLREFRERIINQTDPLALLYRSTMKRNHPEGRASTYGTPQTYKMPQRHETPEKREIPKLLYLILIGIIIFGAILILKQLQYI